MESCVVVVVVVDVEGDSDQGRALLCEHKGSNREHPEQCEVLNSGHGSGMHASP